MTAITATPLTLQAYSYNTTGVAAMWYEQFVARRQEQDQYEFDQWAGEAARELLICRQIVADMRREWLS